MYFLPFFISECQALKLWAFKGGPEDSQRVDEMMDIESALYGQKF